MRNRGSSTLVPGMKQLRSSEDEATCLRVREASSLPPLFSVYLGAGGGEVKFPPEGCIFAKFEVYDCVTACVAGGITR